MDLKEEVQELRERLIKANVALSGLATEAKTKEGKDHYESKRQGVTLALEYMRSVHYD